VVLDAERWLELRRFRALRDAGLSVSEIARETGLHRQTVRKYLSAEVGLPPQRVAQAKRPLAVEPFAHVIDAWLRAELLLKGTVIHDRLVQQYGFTGNYQRVKLYLQEARPRIAEELGIAPDQLAGLHRVAQAAAALLVEVQREAQAGGVDPPVTDLAQVPTAACCDKASATRARPAGSATAVKPLPSLPNAIPARRAWQATYSCPLRMTCAPNGGCPDILTVTWPQSGSIRWNE
jgi:hypothetical protein